MRRLSSKGTFFTKKVFPVLWFGFLFFFVATAMIAKGEIEFEFLLVPLVMAVFGYVLMKRLVFDLVDEVWDTGDELLVKNNKLEDRIRLADIMNISHSTFTNPPRVTLTLRTPSRFGKEITFSPPGSFRIFAKDPVVTELIERVDAKRRG